MAEELQDKPQSRVARMRRRLVDLWEYCSDGVWQDQRRTLRVSAIKTVNLSVRSFLNGDIQTQACAMTYRTVLAIVPALALLLAVGRGFGLQEVLRDELLHYFPAQRQAIGFALDFVDKYLNQATEGVFVGVGIVFLLYTMIMLVSNVESVFNMIWGLKSGRGFWRKITDYTAMLLILPVLMICAAGMSLMLSNTLRAILDFSLLTPLISTMLEIGRMAATWLFFAAAYMLIPNTKVKFKNALMAGIFAGTAFMVLQWLFVTGQLYVSKYNAIYGSFAFLPLLLLWLQLVWVITLSGAVVCFSSQNIFRFNFNSEVANMAPNYRAKVNVAIMAVIVHRFEEGMSPATADDLVKSYEFPVRLVNDTLDLLLRAGLLVRVMISEHKETFGYTPAVSPDALTLGLLGQRIDSIGSRDFIPDFHKNFKSIDTLFAHISKSVQPLTEGTLIKDIKIDLK